MTMNTITYYKIISNQSNISILKGLSYFFKWIELILKSVVKVSIKVRIKCNKKTVSESVDEWLSVETENKILSHIILWEKFGLIRVAFAEIGQNQYKYIWRKSTPTHCCS